MLDDGPTLVVPTFRANRVGWDRVVALWAVADLTPLDMVMGASFACSAVGMFALGNSHRCDRPVGYWSDSFEPRIVGVNGRFRQRRQPFVFEKPAKNNLFSRFLAAKTRQLLRSAGCPQ